MISYQKYCLALVSVLWFLPAHALQIEGEDDGDHFTEIYQNEYYFRLENDRLAFRYHKGKCLMASDQGDVYVENTCEKIAEIQKQFGGMKPEQGAELRKMMQAHEGAIELNEVGSGEVVGYDSTTYSAGFRRDCIRIESASTHLPSYVNLIRFVF